MKEMRPEARALVLALLEKTDATGDEISDVMLLFNDLDHAHARQRRAWDGTPEEFLAAGEYLRQSDELFWTALVALVPMTREQVEAAIEGRPTKLEPPS